MKIKILMIVSILSLGACSKLDRIINGAGSDPADSVVLSDYHVMEGQTVFDYQMIENVPQGDDRTIKVYVKTKDDTGYRELNQYEYNLNPDAYNTPLEFKNRIILNLDGTIIIPLPKRPAAPIGTYYRIVSEKIQY